jgi:hypothetical protein
MNDTPKRGWFTFSIRDILWLTAVVALAVALVYVKWPNGQGRYQFTTDTHESLYIFDTATGRYWRKGPGFGSEWRIETSPDLGPAKP